MAGKSDGSFGVFDPITRQDMAVMIYKAAGVAGAELSSKSATATSFNDQAAISPYAVQAVKALQASGLISGTGNGKLEPKALSNRAQAAVLIYRLFDRL